jgi:thiol-disulfide isomerase/thioredoxin
VRSGIRALLSVVVLVGTLLGSGRSAEAAELEVFTRPGCPRCAEAARFLEELAREMPELRIVTRDVAADPAALARLRALAQTHGPSALGVPAFVVGGELVIGFAGAEVTGRELRRLLVAGAGAAEPADVPLLGPVAVGDVGLPAFTVALGLLDGFNPCAMWVLAFVLSLLVNLHDRRKMLAIGGTFVLVSGVVYFAFMAAWLNVFFLLGHSRLVESLLGGVALGIGALNVKDSVAPGRGPSLSIPAAAKPGIYARVRRIVYAERLLPALVGAAVLATLVNLVELLCTAGLPALYTHVLAQQMLPDWQHYAYLALYDAAYMLDDTLLLLAVVVTLERLKLGEEGGRWLKLASGLVMLGLGALLLSG